MNFEQYQAQVTETDQFPDTDNDDGSAISTPILGIIGELGSLITCFKKKIRDGDAYTNFTSDLREEIGDVLWYTANLATKFEISLSEVADENIAKARDRWIGSLEASRSYKLYDDDFPEKERLPRELQVSFQTSTNAQGTPSVKLSFIDQERKLGDPLTDNSHDDDNYRFHDVFHLSYAAVLGWSPVLRHLIKAKRKSEHLVDEIEDGARACVLEEAISLYIFEYAKRHSFFESVSEIDPEVIDTIRNLTSSYEVKNRTAFEWRSAIFRGYEAYRQLVKNSGGVISINLKARSIKYHIAGN